MLVNKVLRSICFLAIISIGVSFVFFSVVKAEKEKGDTLLGKVIYVDAGHGGKDNGASFDGVLEDEINLKIAGYIMENLIELDAYVLTSRTSDYDLSNVYDKNKKRKDLINRVKQINSSKVDLFISIHLNSYSSENVSGALVFYKNDANSKLLANSIQAHLNVLGSSKKRKTKVGDYYILNKSNHPGVIIECGFLSNNADRKNLVDDSYQRKIAKKVTSGLVEYFNYLVN